MKQHAEVHTARERAANEEKSLRHKYLVASLAPKLIPLMLNCHVVQGANAKLREFTGRLAGKLQGMYNVVRAQLHSKLSSHDRKHTSTPTAPARQQGPAMLSGHSSCICSRWGGRAVGQLVLQHSRGTASSGLHTCPGWRSQVDSWARRLTRL